MMQVASEPSPRPLRGTDYLYPGLCGTNNGHAEFCGRSLRAVSSGCVSQAGTMLGCDHAEDAARIWLQYDRSRGSPANRLPRAACRQLPFPPQAPRRAKCGSRRALPSDDRPQSCVDYAGTPQPSALGAAVFRWPRNASPRRWPARFERMPAPRGRPHSERRDDHLSGRSSTSGGCAIGNAAGGASARLILRKQGFLTLLRRRQKPRSEGDVQTARGRRIISRGSRSSFPCSPPRLAWGVSRAASRCRTSPRPSQNPV
jgi:hypothetical protein